MRTIVLGAGIAGLTAALEESGAGHDVTVVDEYDHLGGNHISHEIGPYSFDIGSFVFFPGFPLFTQFPEVEARCVPLHIAYQRIAPDGRIRRYPFDEREILGLPPHRLAAALASLAAGRLRRGPPRDVADVTARMIGRRLYRQLGLENYLTRFYGLPPDRIDPLFADKRMQQIMRAARIGSLLARAGGRLLPARLRPHRPPAQQVLVRPRAGFAAFYEPVRTALETRGATFRLGEAVCRIARSGTEFRLATDRGELTADRLICTIPAARLLALLGAAPGGLVSSRLTSLFVSFEGRRGFDAMVLFNFQAAGLWKRLTMHSDAYGLADGRSYGSVEVTDAGDAPVGAAAAFADFRAHMSACGLFDGTLRLEGSMVTDHAYPVYALGVVEEIARARAVAAEAGVILAGRQGLHDYLPTSWHVMDQVKAELRRAPAGVTGALRKGATG
ncbi:MAG: FAD-dependent oxidoreductase [Alphaproteobacteria bacterium]